jgi:hypothetical protein
MWSEPQTTESCSATAADWLPRARPALREKLLDWTGLAREKLLVALPDRRTYFRVADLASILQIVGGRFGDDGDDTARCFELKRLPTLKASLAADRCRDYKWFFSLDCDGHNNCPLPQSPFDFSVDRSPAPVNTPLSLTL